MKARVTAASQTHRLREQMQDARIHHGQEVRADISNVRVIAGAGRGDAEVFFCNIDPIRVNEVLSPGDTEPLPTTAVVEGVEFPEAGDYDIRNVLITANGDIRLTGDRRTRVRLHSRLLKRFIAGSLLPY